MANAKGVVGAFGALRKTGDAIELAQRRHAVAAPRQNLVGIGLVTHVPDQSVFWGVKHRVQRYGEFDRAEIGGKVPTRLRDRIEQKLPEFLADLSQLFTRQFAKIRWGIDLGKKRC